MPKGTSPSIIGGALLITGSCIGAGMLALPIVTGHCGFFPAIIILLFAWLLMTSTALLIVEVSGWFEYKRNFSTMIESLLGKFARSICFILYLFLFYSLLVAYIVLSGRHCTEIINETLSINIEHWKSSLLFVLVFGSIIYIGMKPVDLVNRFLMIFKILSFSNLSCNDNKICRHQ